MLQEAARHGAWRKVVEMKLVAGGARSPPGLSKSRREKLAISSCKATIPADKAGRSPCSAEHKWNTTLLLRKIPSLDPSYFPKAEKVQLETNLGQLALVLTHDGSTDGISIHGARWPRFLLADVNLQVFAEDGRSCRERDAQQSPQQIDHNALMHVLGVQLHPSAKLWSTLVVYVLDPSSIWRGNAAPLTWEKAGGEQEMLSTRNEYLRI